MTFIITMMSGKTYKISEETAKKLVGKSGLTFINEIGVAVNLNSVEVIEPENLAIENKRATMKEGYLHDGTKVIKKFGTWVMPQNDKIKLDPHYYPEIARDQILTEEEWADLKFGRRTLTEIIGMQATEEFAKFEKPNVIKKLYGTTSTRSEDEVQ